MAIYTDKNDFLLGHGLELHSLDSTAGPNTEQFFPPCKGGGLVQLLERVCTPLPHVTLHCMNSDHSL